jgi:hypothetical protein
MVAMMITPNSDDHIALDGFLALSGISATLHPPLGNLTLPSSLDRTDRSRQRIQVPLEAIRRRFPAMRSDAIIAPRPDAEGDDRSGDVVHENNHERP